MDKTQILIVEDEGLIAKDLQAMLRRLGYLVPVTVGTGEMAIQTAVQNSPDLILMDINLRGKVDGVQAAEAIRSIQDTPIVFLTANSDETNFQRAKLTDPFGFLIKPFEERSLHAGIEMALYKHRTERQTREREQWLSTTLKSIADGVMTTDAQGKITFLNAVAESLLGWTSEESLGRHYTEIFPVTDEVSRRAPAHAIVKALSKGQGHSRINHTLLVPRNGIEIHIEHSVAPIRDNHDSIAGYVIVFSDVSLQKKLEEELRQSQKMDAIGKLAGSIAHDFNNAITAMMGYSSLMLAKLPASDPLRDDAGQILRAAEHSARLTRQLLAFSRKQITEPVRLNMGSTVEEMQGLLRRLTRENITLAIARPENLWDVCVDPGHFEQLVLNITVNARDAMPRGGELNVSLENVSFSAGTASEIRGASPGDFVALRISDTGTGMSQEIMDRIFEPFFTTKERDRGTGMGLSTCDGIVKQAGGFINVSSELGVGTAFTVYLPRTEMTSAHVEETSAETGSTLGGNEMILIVEDEEVVRTLGVRVLEDLGYRVLEAENGVDALAVLEQQHEAIDVIITDLIMPEMNGRELVEQARKAGCTAKILFISGYTDGDILSDTISLTNVAFLPKPFSPDILAGKVREVLAAEVTTVSSLES